MGRIAGPDNPPVKFPIRLLRVLISMAMAVKVLTMLTASAPPASAARAISAISVTLGDNLAMTGNLDMDFIFLTNCAVAAGSWATKTLCFKLGQDKFNSTAVIPS